MSVSLASLRSRLFLLVFLSLLPALGLMLYSGLKHRRLTTAGAQGKALEEVHGIP